MAGNYLRHAWRGPSRTDGIKATLFHTHSTFVHTPPVHQSTNPPSIHQSTTLISLLPGLNYILVGSHSGLNGEIWDDVDDDHCPFFGHNRKLPRIFSGPAKRNALKYIITTDDGHHDIDHHDQEKQKKVGKEEEKDEEEKKWKTMLPASQTWPVLWPLDLMVGTRSPLHRKPEGTFPHPVNSANQPTTRNHGRPFTGPAPKSS